MPKLRLISLYVKKKVQASSSSSSSSPPQPLRTLTLTATPNYLLTFLHQSCRISHRTFFSFSPEKKKRHILRYIPSPSFSFSYPEVHSNFLHYYLICNVTHSFTIASPLLPLSLPESRHLPSQTLYLTLPSHGHTP